MEKPEAATVRAKPRLVGLDLLRLLAVVLVLGRHMEAPPETGHGGWQSFLSAWVRGGWVGVDLFFVLSGFLVSGLLFTEYKSRGHISIGRFYMRRGWKIYPPFYALIAATVLLNLGYYGRSLPPWPLVSELLFLQSYLPGLWNHTWSLAVEEHFYLLLPLVLILVLKLNKGSPTPLKPVLALAACVAVSALLLRLLNWYCQPNFSYLTHLYASHLRLDSLFFGVAISYAYHFHTSWFIDSLTPWRWPMIVGGILLLTPAFLLPLDTTPFIYTVGLTVFYIGSGMLLMGILLCKLPHTRLFVLLAGLGGFSYSIYLWHMPVRVWGLSLAERVWGTGLGFEVRSAVFWIGSFVVGVVMAKIIELPTLRLRDRWFPPRAGGPIEVQTFQPPD